MPRSRRALLFFALATACLLPWVGPAAALATGILFGLVLGNPGLERTAVWSKFLLQASVVGLGFGLSLETVWRVGTRSAVYTVVGIAATLAAGLLIGRLVGTSGPLSTLISFGTAICGGSAIAAMAPVVKAKTDEIAVSLATVFTLNATALVLFPAVGHLLHLDQGSFGLWAGLAIHDTSSVVGAASAYGPVALGIATTVKLTRALWIVPCVLVAAYATKSGQRVKFPLFIAGFLAAAAVRTLLPSLQPVWTVLVAVARQSLVLTLYLIGAGLTRDVLRRVGIRPLVQGVLLWALASAGTLVAITSGFATPP
jgi:uncharacterized integral membrane protein (TIGR00698 family)